MTKSTSSFLSSQGPVERSEEVLSGREGAVIVLKNDKGGSQPRKLGWSLMAESRWTQADSLEWKEPLQDSSAGLPKSKEPRAGV